eukprot:jgi/Mesvir1/21599/Mv04029-RA.1
MDAARALKEAAANRHRHDNKWAGSTAVKRRADVPLASAKLRAVFTMPEAEDESERTRILEIDRATYPGSFKEVKKVVAGHFGLDEDQWDLESETTRLGEDPETKEKVTIHTLKYRGVKLHIAKQNPFFHAQLPGYSAETEVIDNDDKWRDAIADQPWDDDQWRMYSGKFLKHKMQATSLDLHEEGVHGLWELSVNKEHHRNFSRDMLEELVKALHSTTFSIVIPAMAAVWSLAPSASMRGLLTDLGAVEGLLVSAKLSFGRLTDESSRETSSRRSNHLTREIRDRVQVYSLGALGVLLIDPQCRAKLFRIEPTAYTHIRLAKPGKNADPQVQPLEIKIQNMAAETLCSMLVRDSSTRALFASSGGLLQLIPLLQTQNLHVRYCAVIALSLYAKDEEGRVLVSRSGAAKKLFNQLLELFRWCLSSMKTVHLAPPSNKQISGCYEEGMPLEDEVEPLERMLVPITEAAALSLWGAVCACLAPGGGGISRDEMKTLVDMALDTLNEKGASTATHAMLGVLAALCAERSTAALVMERERPKKPEPEGEDAQGPSSGATNPLLNSTPSFSRSVSMSLNQSISTSSSRKLKKDAEPDPPPEPEPEGELEFKSAQFKLLTDILTRASWFAPGAWERPGMRYVQAVAAAALAHLAAHEKSFLPDTPPATTQAPAPAAGAHGAGHGPAGHGAGHAAGHAAPRASTHGTSPAAAQAAALVATQAPPAPTSDTTSMTGQHREVLSELGALQVLLHSLRFPLHPDADVKQEEACAAGIMYLCTVAPAQPLQAEMREMLLLMVGTHSARVMQHLAAALWCLARHEPYRRRLALGFRTPDDQLEAAAVASMADRCPKEFAGASGIELLVTNTRKFEVQVLAATSKKDPAIKLTEFAIGTMWLLLTDRPASEGGPSQEPLLQFDKGTWWKLHHEPERDEEASVTTDISLLLSFLVWCFELSQPVHWRIKQLAVCAAWALGSRVASAQVRLVRMGVCELLGSIALQGDNRATLRCLAASLLQVLALTPEGRAREGSKDLVEEVMVALLRSDNALLEERGALGLAHLAMEGSNKLSIAAKGGISAVVAALKKPKTDNILINCLSGLLNLSTHPDNQVHICVKGLSPLMDVTLSADSSEQVCQLGSCILTNLSLNPANRTRLYKAELHYKHRIVTVGLPKTVRAGADAMDSSADAASPGKRARPLSASTRSADGDAGNSRLSDLTSPMSPAQPPTPPDARRSTVFSSEDRDESDESVRRGSHAPGEAGHPGGGSDDDQPPGLPHHDHAGEEHHGVGADLLGVPTWSMPTEEDEKKAAEEEAARVARKAPVKERFNVWAEAAFGDLSETGSQSKRTPNYMKSTKKEPPAALVVGAKAGGDKTPPHVSEDEGRSPLPGLMRSLQRPVSTAWDRSPVFSPRSPSPSPRGKVPRPGSAVLSPTTALPRPGSAILSPTAAQGSPLSPTAASRDLKSPSSRPPSAISVNRTPVSPKPDRPASPSLPRAPHGHPHASHLAKSSPVSSASAARGPHSPQASRGTHSPHAKGTHSPQAKAAGQRTASGHKASKGAGGEEPLSSPLLSPKSPGVYSPSPLSPTATVRLSSAAKSGAAAAAAAGGRGADAGGDGASVPAGGANASILSPRTSWCPPISEFRQVLRPRTATHHPTTASLVEDAPSVAQRLLQTEWPKDAARQLDECAELQHEGVKVTLDAATAASAAMRVRPRTANPPGIADGTLSSPNKAGSNSNSNGHPGHVKRNAGSNDESGSNSEGGVDANGDVEATALFSQPLTVIHSPSKMRASSPGSYSSSTAGGRGGTLRPDSAHRGSPLVANGREPSAGPSGRSSATGGSMASPTTGQGGMLWDEDDDSSDEDGSVWPPKKLDFGRRSNSAGSHRRSAAQTRSGRVTFEGGVGLAGHSRGQPFGDGGGEGMEEGPVVPPDSFPVMVVVQPDRPRNRIQFRGAFDLGPDNPRRKFLIFEHVDGSHVCNDLYQHFVLPNGRTAHFYQSGAGLVDEIDIPLEAPPEEPLELPQLLQDALPMADVLTELSQSSGVARDILPLHFKPVPLLAPRPARHTLDVIPHECPRPERCGLHGAIAKKDPLFVLTEQPTSRVEEEIRRWNEVMQRELWSLNRSVFSSRRNDSDAHSCYDSKTSFGAMFELDWTRLLQKTAFFKFVEAELTRARAMKAGFTDAEVDRAIQAARNAHVEMEMAEVKEALRPHYVMIWRAFEYFCSLGTGPWTSSLQLSEYNRFLRDCEIPDPGSKFCKRPDCDAIFLATNVEEAGQDNIDANDDEALCRFEMVEVVVRLGVAKYGKGQGNVDVSTAVETFIAQNLVPFLGPDILVDKNIFRTDRLYTESVDELLAKHTNLLHRVFDRYRLASATAVAAAGAHGGDKKPHGHGDGSHGHEQEHEKEGGKEKEKEGGKGGIDAPLMSSACWMEFVEAARLIDDFFSHRDAKMVFMWSRMQVVDDLQDRRRNESLTFVDFLEALGRIADLRGLPTQEQVKASGFPDIYAFMYDNTARLEHGRGGNRISASVDGTDPLHMRLQVLLDFVFRALLYKGQPPNTFPFSLVKLGRQLKSEESAIKAALKASG